MAATAKQAARLAMIEKWCGREALMFGLTVRVIATYAETATVRYVHPRTGKLYTERGVPYSRLAAKA